MSKRSPLIRNPSLRRLLGMLRPHQRVLWVSIFAMAVTAASDVAVAKLTGSLLDEGFYKKDMAVAVLVLFGLVGAFVARGLSQFAGSYLTNRISQNVLVELRQSMFDRMLRWPAIAFERTPSGTVISKFLNEASNALNLAAETLMTAIRDSLTTIALLGFLLYLNWLLTLVMFVVVPLIAVLLRLFSKRLNRLNVDNQAMLAEMTSTVQEGYDGARVIKIYDGFEYESARFTQINHRLRGLARRMQVAWSASTPITQIVAAIGVAVLVYIGMTQASGNNMSAGEFVSFLTAALALLQPLRHLASLNGPLARMIAGADSVFAMIDASIEVDTGTRDLGDARGEVEFRSVSFKYDSAVVPALDRVNLKVASGEMIALVGPSGGGKTTFINLIPRFLVPVGGDILFDGIPASELTLASIRRQIALVSQDVVLFDDSVAANIAYGAQREANMAQIRAAAEAANLLSFIESLPQGFDSPIGENAMKLSGGQRQRLSIARALLKNAPILLLDEATSALDSESERAIQASLEKLMIGRTTFVVAHRLSTVERADRIVVLDRGRIAETGTHEELLAKRGVYANLYQIQFSPARQAQDAGRGSADA